MQIAAVMLLSSIIFNDGVSQVSAPFNDMESCMKAARALLPKNAEVQVDSNSIRSTYNGIQGRTVIYTVTCNKTDR